MDDHGGEGEATTPTAQRSQELCADDTVSSYSLFVFEHDCLWTCRILEIFHLYTRIRRQLFPDKINVCCHPGLSYLGILFRSLTSSFSFSRRAWVTMTFFPFAIILNGRELPWPFSFLQWAWVIMAIFLFNCFPKQAGIISTFFFLQWAGVTSTGLLTPTFTSLLSLKCFHSLFSFLAQFLSPIACRNSAALSDFVSGLPFSSTKSSFRNGLDLLAHLLGRRSPVFDLADCIFVLGRIAWIFRSHIIYDAPIIAHHRRSELHLPCSTSGQGLAASGFRMGVDGLLQALLVVRGGPERFFNRFHWTMYWNHQCRRIHLKYTDWTVQYILIKDPIHPKPWKNMHNTDSIHHHYILAKLTGITFFWKIILEDVFLENAFLRKCNFLRKLPHFLRKRFWEIFYLGAGPWLRSAVGEHVSEVSFL